MWNKNTMQVMEGTGIPFILLEDKVPRGQGSDLLIYNIKYFLY